MAMSDKGALLPPSTAPHAPEKHCRHPAPVTAYYPAPSGFVPSRVHFPPPPRTHYATHYHLYNDSAEYNQAQQQQTTTSLVNVVSEGEPAVVHNVSQAEIVRSNYVQIPNVYPGCAFCKFVPGVIETLIRLAIVVMLIVLIAVAGVTIVKISAIMVTVGGIFYVSTAAWRPAPGYIIFIAFIPLVTEGIMLLLRLLNPKCFNNRYRCFGRLDIAMCVVLGIFLLGGCIAAGIGIEATDVDLELFCNSFKIPLASSDDSCEQLQTIHNWVIATTVVNIVCTVLILILFIWDYVYLCAGFNSRIPVPRGIKVQHQ